jgi:carboxyl-terminal processing protease
MKRPWRIPALLLVPVALVFGGLAASRGLADGDGTRDDLRLVAELVDVEHERYGSEVSYRDIVYSSINGMLRSLDPHTSFLSPEAYAGMREKQQTSFCGIGILVGVRNGQLTVISPIEGGPASRQGIQAGDVISTIEGEPTEAMTLDEAVSKLKGPKGTQVRFTVVRRGLDEPLAMSVTRAEIPQTTERVAYMMTADTGYIQLTEFSRGTDREMADAVAKLEALGMKQLLLDLRNNGGGLLDQAIEVAELFLPRGSVVVETRGRIRDSMQTLRASGKHSPLDLPVVVLVNEGTASAAEIVTGALQDHDVALVAGKPSWGKGLVQTVYNLSQGAGLALTTARYHTPSGRMLQRDYSSFFDYYRHENAGPPADLAKAQVFHTDLGREVYGGGGITPDVAVEDVVLAPFEQFLLARNAYVSFAVDYQRRNQIKAADWKPGAAVVDELRRWLIAEKRATAKEVDEGLAQEGVRTDSLLQIRAEVLNIALGNEARHRAMAGGDPQIQAALGLFGRAGELLAKRRGRDGAAGATSSRYRSARSEDRVASTRSPFLFGVPMLAATADAGRSDEDSLYEYLSVFTEVLGLVRQAYVDEPDMEKLMAGALGATTDALDPFSIYVPPSAVDGYLRVSQPGGRNSGVVVLEEHGITYVVAVEKGSPAATAGVVPGDIVSRVNGRSTRPMPPWEVRELLTGKPGSTLELELIRLGEQRRVSMRLSPYTPPPASLSTTEAAPVLRIPTFDATTAPTIEKLLGAAEETTKAGLLVDLRGVSSGDPEAAYAVAELFAEGDLGSLIGRKGELRAFASRRAPVWHGRLVVLVDRGTLGAAEILATVLRQKAKAELVGERTFGHAGRLGTAALSNGGRLFYTEAFYSGPDEKPLQEGLRPDLVVDERSRTYLEKDMPITELILMRGVQHLLDGEQQERKAA